jgi:hypothetical protein
LTERISDEFGQKFRKRMFHQVMSAIVALDLIADLQPNRIALADGALKAASSGTGRTVESVIISRFRQT